MKILLINPPPFYHGRNSRFLEKTPVQTFTVPLGLAYIASFLQKEKYEVHIIDAYVKNLPFEKLMIKVNDLNPEIIGITCLSDQRASWFKLIHLIRSLNNSIKIVLGGPHPTLMTEQILTHCQPDAIVIGEGEETMLDLVKAWENNKPLNKVKGIAYLKGKNVVFTEPRKRIRDLDYLPFPAYDQFDLDDYSGWFFMNTLYRMIGLSKSPKYGTMSTSRGCLGNCSFCSAPLIWNRQWTKRSAKNVVDEMELLKKEYNVDFIILTDDTFTVDQERVRTICNEIIKRNLKLLWAFETAVNFVSYDVLALAKRAGCCFILYGVESGSEHVLSGISKKIKVEEIVHAFNITKRAGIITVASLMVGNPGETENTINITLSLLKTIEPDIVLPQIAMITPRTKLFETAKRQGFIDETYWLTDLPFPYYTCESSLGKLVNWHWKLLHYNT
jgi:anaerobic magnesium-protoporphyrin IX monomethyl ester cyclase